MVATIEQMMAQRPNTASLGVVNAEVSNEPVVYDFPIYDTNYIPPTGVQDVSFYTSNTYFTGPAALIGTQKTENEYNLDQEGALASPNEHRAIGLQMHLMADAITGARPTLDAALQLANEATVRILLGDEQRAYITRLQRVGGPRWNAQGNALSLFFSFGIGYGPEPDAWLRFGEYIPNPTDAFFEVRVRTSPDYDISAEMPDGVRMRIALCGYLLSRTG